MTLLLTSSTIFWYNLVQTLLSPLDCLFSISLAYADDLVDSSQRGILFGQMTALFMLAVTFAPLVGTLISRAVDSHGTSGNMPTPSHSHNGVSEVLSGRSGYMGGYVDQSNCSSNCTACSLEDCRSSTAYCYYSAPSCSRVPDFRVLLWICLALSVGGGVYGL